MSAKSSIQVCIKVRPCEPELPTLWQVKDKRAIQPLDSQADPCVFDYVYDQGSNNQEVFDGMAKHIVEACVKGFNGTIFAYGQTSSGKTYTMMGDQQNPGVMVLAAKEIFNQIASHSDRDFLLRVGYIEIYNEKIYDLLNKKNQDLKIYESNGMVNVNCEECIITSEDDLLQFLCLGNKERTVGETNMNERSSRSHAIFRIIIESRKADRSDDDAVIQSILNLVDLAGSERADQTGARGARLKEGSHINKSLHFLSNVIKSLAENEDNKYVNYRDSKLTRILQASLGGNAFTSIICTIRPSIMEESQSTLNFAMRAKKIRLKPQLNEIVSDATMMKRLEREIKLLKDRLAEEQAKNESQLKVKLLEQRIKTDTLKIITSNTITDCRNKNRRRTWCPASTNLEVLATGLPDAQVSIPVPVTNGLKKPNVNINHSNLPKPSFYPTSNRPVQRGLTGAKTINIMKSLEVKEDLVSVEEPNFEQATNQLTVGHTRMRTITLTPTMAQLGPKGREMLERELVELEAFVKIEQQINAEWDELNEKLATAIARNDELQTERLNLLQRSEALQAEVDDLKKSKEAADKKIANYEEQLKTLKATVDRLDMENRAAVELEFQFASHQTKSKLRENELLTALSEKNSAIDNLQKSLNDLSSEMLRNSKDDHMRSICPTLETNCELICRKCVDLERLLEEYNNKPNDKSGALAIDCECEQLRADIASTRAQLESLQNAYKQITSDAAGKTELCDRLSRDVISAEEAKCALQGKCDDLEQTQHRHEQTIKKMQDEYESIQQKYNALQQDYENLERTAAATEDEHKKLQRENEYLQREISTLKQCVEEMQMKLLETAVLDVHEALVQQLRASNEELMTNLANMETKYGELQVEYDDLSIQLVESVQDGDSLREQFNLLQETLKKAPIEADRLQAHIERLEKEVDEKNQLLEATECTINEMRDQMTNLQSELLEKSVIVNKVEDYQRQIESLEKQHAEMTMVCEELQEKVKETTINESLSKSTSTVIESDIDSEQVHEIDILKGRLAILNDELKELQNKIKKQLALVQQKDTVIEKMQLEMQELKERCWSMDVQQVELRSNAQQQQQLLDMQAVKLADDANRIDRLQESNAKLTERSIKAEEALEERLNLATDFDVTKTEYEKRLQHLQTALVTAREEITKQEKLNKDELDNANLEFLQKIESSESRYRENLHKYNTEWEDRLQKLSSDGEAQLLAAKAEIAAEREQLINEKHELKSLYDNSKKSVAELHDKLSLVEKDSEKIKAYAKFETLSNDQLKDLREKYEKQLHDFEQLKYEHQQHLDSLHLEKNALQCAVDDGIQIIERLRQELESERNLRQNESSQLSRELEDAIEANTKAKAEYTEQLQTYTEKMSDLQEELKEANLLANGIEKLTLEQQQIQEVLAKTNEQNKLLEVKVEDLKRELLLAQTEVTNQRTNLENLQSKLDYTHEAKNNFSSAEAIYTQKLHDLEKEMSDQAHQYNRKIEELQSSAAELNIKMEALVKRKLELEASNDELAVKLKDELAIHEILKKEREHSENLQQINVLLESQLKAKQTDWDTLQQSLQQAETQLNFKKSQCDALQQSVEQTNSQLLQLKLCLNQAESQLELKMRDCDSLQQSLQQATSQLDTNQTALDVLQKSLEQLQLKLEKSNKVSFDADRERLDATISSLLEDKRNLEEKLCTTNEIVQKLEMDLRNKINSSNISFDSTTSNTSPAPRKSLDRDHHQPRKSLISESEVRRNRRISTHDERRQSYWNDSRHVACMTDPVGMWAFFAYPDTNCNCTELDRKLKECQFELFVRDSKVTALSIELKNHPLKEENAQLKKRLQEEQHKSRDEIKRIKSKNSDLMSKVNAYSASAAISSSVQCATVLPPKLSHVETQTESDLEVELKKTTEKLNDCIQICRHRYNHIKDLEERLKQNENSDTSNISSQTIGQINLLKSKLEIQKKEIITLSNKYEYAKKALKLRKDEIEELRKGAGTAVTAASYK
ncbi:hypothetical protein KR044_012579 [Drosophila immigrans]|nr:hypothetical protein KR044_012579 [Drosophila immigrans]